MHAASIERLRIGGCGFVRERPKTPACVLCCGVQSDKPPEALLAQAAGGMPSTTDPIAAVTACDSVLMLARASGVVNRYSLPHLTLDATHVLRCRPQVRVDRAAPA